MGYEFDPSKLIANMDAIRTRIATVGQRRAVIAGARVIGAAMEEQAPILDHTTPGSDSLDPGDIKANIKVRTRQKDGGVVALVGPHGKDGRIPQVAYLVEYGHRMVKGGQSKLGSDGKFVGGGKVSQTDVPAHPFLRPAYESSASAALEAVAISLGSTLKEAGK
jgi:HK97 gp10 family phage protein